MKYNYSFVGHNSSEFEEATYTGDYKAGKRDGKGKLVWQDGSSFTGEWRNDERHYGEMRFSNGNMYVGSFSNDKFDGTGKLYLTTGVIFDGKFEKGFISTVGQILYPNGDVYFGQHRGFVKQGAGKMIYLNGSTYEGGWDNDKKSGKGRMHDHISGDIYSGEYFEGKRSGRGRMYYASLLEIYEGEWINDRRQGEGTIINSKGEVCTGDFRADHMEGKMKHLRTVSSQQTARIFRSMCEQNDIYLNADKQNTVLETGTFTRSEAATRQFNELRTKLSASYSVQSGIAQRQLVEAAQGTC